VSVPLCMKLNEPFMNKTKGKYSRIRLLLVCLAALLLLLLGGGVFFVRNALDLENNKSVILEALQAGLHRRVIYEKGSFSFKPAPSFTFKKIEIMDRDGSRPFLRADRLTFKVSLLPLLDRRLVVKKVELDRPAATVVRDSAGVLSIADLLGAAGKGVSMQIRGFTVKGGTLRFVDRAIGPGEVVTSMEGIALSMTHLFWGKSSHLKLSASLVQGNGRGDVRISGTVTPAAKGKPLTDTSFSGSVEASDLDAGHFWGYYRPYVPFQKIDGRFQLDGSFKGKLARFSSKGKIKVRNVRFAYPQVFHSVLTPKKIALSYALELTEKDLDVTSLHLDVDGLDVKGSCALRDLHSGDIFIDARAATSKFRLEDFGGYIPYGIIATDASEYIEQHIKGGLYRLEKGTLAGRVSQIAHMEKGTNYNVLFIKGTVEKGLLSYGPAVPAFNDISGNLEMRGRDFILSGMRANFGTSPFALEGRITDYPLKMPCRYPFTMSMKPRPPEVAWLLQQQKSRQFAFSGDSDLSLQGNGTTSGYLLSGTWDLSAAALSWRDLIAKPAGRAARLSFQSMLDEEGTRVPVFRYDMGPLSLAGAVEYFPGRKTVPLFSIRSNDIPLQAVAPEIPKLARYKPSGKMRLNLKGVRKQPGDLALTGELALSGASFKADGFAKPVTGINSTILFQGDTLKAPHFTARIGNSNISGSGALAGFSSPAVSLSFSSPSLDLADLGLYSGGKPVIAHKVHGSATLRNEAVTIRQLSFQVNRSALRLSGTVHDPRHPRADLVLDASYLDMDDVALLAALERGKEVRKEPSRLSLNATVTAEAGRFNKVDFRKLRTSVHLEQKVLYLEGVECAVLGGAFAGKGRIDFGSVGGPRYQASFDVRNFSAAQFLQVLDTGRELTGTMSLEGELTAKGDSFAEIKASSLGNVKLHCEKGSLRKFALLSKLFSVLNVSQLFKFRLPDMVSGGMPYNQINASFSFRDGVVTTNDLFIDSNAMNISMVGNFDLVKERLDVTIGVKPLQTVDKVISRIPVVGWVLTGKNKSLISAYFTAKGSLDNPTVTPVTVTSLAKGVFNIFKRLFSLPAKLVTDTGEVIINK